LEFPWRHVWDVEQVGIFFLVVFIIFLFVSFIDSRANSTVRRSITAPQSDYPSPTPVNNESEILVLALVPSTIEPDPSPQQRHAHNVMLGLWIRETQRNA
jgi:hypothetical protein